jgi:uncharacterized membrane protein YeaQ/YmgE (transglycosylase-associated protein family)
MIDFLSETWNPLCELFGSLVRPLGGLVLGVAIGWLAESTFLDEAKEWQLKIAIFLGLLGAFVCLHIYSGPATTGFFALGAGVAAIFLGIRQNQPAKKK